MCVQAVLQTVARTFKQYTTMYKPTTYVPTKWKPACKYRCSTKLKDCACYGVCVLTAANVVQHDGVNVWTD
jgi:hypothetical protein